MPTDPVKNTPEMPATGETSLFLNRATLAAQQKLTQAKNEQATTLVAAHTHAQPLLDEAHGKAIDLAGSNLRYAYVEWRSSDGQQMGQAMVDSTGKAALGYTPPNRYPSASPGAPSNVAIDTKEMRLYLMDENSDLICVDLKGGVAPKRVGSYSPDSSMPGYLRLGRTGIGLEYVPEGLGKAGAVAFDPGEKLIFWQVNTTLRQTDLTTGVTEVIAHLPDVPPTMPRDGSQTNPWRLRLDTINKIIYWSNRSQLGFVCYGKGEPEKGVEGYGIGGYDLMSPADRVFAFDYNSSFMPNHLVLYRPGTGKISILWFCLGYGFRPVESQAALTEGTGLGGYDLMSNADRAFAFDYDGSGKQDHLVVYRPGTGRIWILKNTDGAFSPVYRQDVNGIGGYDLMSPADRVLAFDYDGSGRPDHLVLYRPGTGRIWILKNSDGVFSPVYQEDVNGIGGYDLRSPADRLFYYYSNWDPAGKYEPPNHLVAYRPGSGTPRDWSIGPDDHNNGLCWILKRKPGTADFEPVYTGPTIGNNIGYTFDSTDDRAFAFPYDDGNGEQTHLAFYRPGGGTFWLRKASFGFLPGYTAGMPGFLPLGYQATWPAVGVGGYDLTSPADRAFAFDYSSAGVPDHVVLYRPGTGRISIVSKAKLPAPARERLFTPVYDSSSMMHPELPDDHVHWGGGWVDLNASELVAVDSVNKFAYCANGETGAIWRIHLEMPQSQVLIMKSCPSPRVATVDLAAQLLYWFDPARQCVMRAPLPQIGAPPLDPGTSQRVAFPYAFGPGPGDVMQLVLITSDDAAFQALAEAKGANRQALLGGPKMIAQARTEATQKRTDAHVQLDKSHTDAAQSIAIAQQSAATQRQQARDDAAKIVAAASATLEAAKVAAAAKAAQAATDAQKKLDASSAQATAAKEAAQKRLDDARKALQKS